MKIKIAKNTGNYNSFLTGVISCKKETFDKLVLYKNEHVQLTSILPAQ